MKPNKYSLKPVNIVANSLTHNTEGPVKSDIGLNNQPEMHLAHLW